MIDITGWTPLFKTLIQKRDTINHVHHEIKIEYSGHIQLIMVPIPTLDAHLHANHQDHLNHYGSVTVENSVSS